MRIFRRPLPCLALAAALVVACGPASGQSDAEWTGARAAMVQNIKSNLAAGHGGELRRIDPKVLAVMREVPRHLFVPPMSRGLAYTDRPLDIGHEATISSPFIVAAMTQLVDPDPGEVMLEVGTGSGYQAAVLSRLVGQVYSIEIVEPLADEASRRLAELGHRNVTVKAGDGYAGWPQHAPFDGILVTAGATHIPAPLLAQLKPDGVMVIPLGPTAAEQQLVVVRKDRRGRATTRRVMPVAFIPLDERARTPAVKR